MTHDGATGATEAEWRQLERSGVGDWGGGLRVRDVDGATRYGADVTYLGNRFRAAAAHEIDVVDARPSWRGAALEYAGARVRGASRIAVGTAVGYAGGRIAFGREIGEGFVLLDPDPSLKSRRVPVLQGGRTVAIVDRQPVLAPVTQAYRRLDLTLDGSALPDGYDLGDPRLVLRPALRSAFVRTVGSPAMTISARLHDREGLPASRRAGLLRSLDGNGAAPIAFFTNSNGGLIVERVPPGRYAVHLDGREEAVAELAVPRGGDGVADLGEVTMRIRDD